MIFSDRSIREAISSGQIQIQPFEPSYVQPSSVDLRVSNGFRVFVNHRYGQIDPRSPQADLTQLVEVGDDEPFMLHPGEFVLGSTLERVKLGDDVVARLEGKSSLGRLGLLIHSSLPASEPVLIRTGGSVRWRPIEEVVRKRLMGEVVSFDPETFKTEYHPITGWYEGPADHIFEVVLASGRRVRVTAGHNLFALDREGSLTKVRTGELTAGTFVAIPGVLPGSRSDGATLDLLGLAAEPHLSKLMLEGEAIEDLITTKRLQVESILHQTGIDHTHYYLSRFRLPAHIALQFDGVATSRLQVSARGSARSMPNRIEVTTDLAWLLGLYVAEGYRRSKQVNWANKDQSILDRVECTLKSLGLSVYRTQESVTCSSTLLSMLIGWLEVGDDSHHKRVPPLVFGWRDDLVASFVDGLIDGDGSRQASRVSLWTSSVGLVGDMLALLPRLGRRASVSMRMRSRGVLYQLSIPRREHKLLTASHLMPTMERLVEGDLLWDRVVEVRDTGESEPVFDLEVRPQGRKVENFLAGRGGVFVSNTAGFIDPGFEGHITLELSNVATLPIAIYPGMKIGQISFYRMTTEADHPYGSPALGSKYQGQTGPTASRSHQDFDPLPGR